MLYFNKSSKLRDGLHVRRIIVVTPQMREGKKRAPLVRLEFVNAKEVFNLEHLNSHKSLVEKSTNYFNNYIYVSMKICTS